MLPHSIDAYYLYREKRLLWKIDHFISYEPSKIIYSPIERTVFNNYCHRCRRRTREHVEGKCLFDTTRFYIGESRLWNRSYELMPIVFREGEHVFEGVERTVAELNIRLNHAAE